MGITLGNWARRLVQMAKMGKAMDRSFKAKAGLLPILLSTLLPLSACVAVPAGGYDPSTQKGVATSLIERVSVCPQLNQGSKSSDRFAQFPSHHIVVAINGMPVPVKGVKQLKFLSGPTTIKLSTMLMGPMGPVDKFETQVKFQSQPDKRYAAMAQEKNGKFYSWVIDPRTNEVLAGKPAPEGHRVCEPPPPRPMTAKDVVGGIVFFVLEGLATVMS
jgi:hypothetical protein